MIRELFEKEGFTLDEEQERKFSIYLQELLRWNKVHNLTSIKKPEEIVRRHFIDSVSVVRCFERIGLDLRGKHFADVGSGAGFPGVPLKIYLKDIKLTLIESVSKKCSFLEYLKIKLNEDYRVLCTRAEKVEEKFDVVLARALGEFEEVKEILEKLSIGYVFVYKGSKLKEEWLKDYKLCELSLSFMPKSYILWKKV
ncbi:16S rRNA (guanine(527)-N(7))-methyltransferase RsmG [Aquifex aeolicus]|uniref:Ribosomal RNA small subunit methyltransferase G n=1 Tax=Aquifex aeolicus (strain VF5) TaxID=224324 RepID=RSMG_AQUAE|nr:16S rRNA (guanine(527)-N(7))-methyltransferase RsmG [Aquifex aeolicus]O67522.1 RecName: Full=Ribosomal RNA small subunit methyltransferase G; AltName: Full=16S rRNA 7-methylguanosine methyltransferase; Short=16S rRNA m7G methyltransferase [Aquifex aeolicus VF5]AAC07476.1 glucose inhibited division protein B [Aquifex aeolicus VF5]